MVAVGMQVKPVVMPPPDRADLTGLLQHHDVKPGRAHRHGAGKPRGARTDDDGVEWVEPSASKSPSPAVAPSG